MKDSTGLETSVQDRQTLDAYADALATLSRFDDPTAQITRMLDAEPDFWMGRVFAAHVALWSTDRDDLPGAQAQLAALEGLEQGRANDRERRHLAALRAWVAGDLHGAARLLDELSIHYPTDLLALLSGHQLDFFLGDAQNLRDRVARAISRWDSEHPWYGYLLGMLSFGQEEAGHYQLAETTGRRALERNPGDIWGIHAVAHALEMQGAFDQGVRFLSDTAPVWTEGNAMVSHNGFHLSLFQLEADDLPGALATYDRHVHVENSSLLPMVLLDGSGVLWRLFLDGHDVSQRARRLADDWAAKTGQDFYSFNDAHAIMAYAAAGDLDTAQRLVDELRRQAATDQPTSNSLMSREVGLPVSEALLAFARQDYAGVVDRLLPIKSRTQLFGGSHAQRDVLARTLLEAAIRAGRRPLAQALLSERLTARPNSLYNRTKQAQVAALGGR